METHDDAQGRARTALRRLCAATFVAYASYSICRVPLLPLFARDLGADPSMVGLVVGASTITGIVLKMPAGLLSDQLGRRPLLLAGALVFALLPISYLAVGSLAMLITLRAVHGSATAIFSPVASASVADIAPAAQRGTWMSAHATAQGTGQALGPVLAGYLLATGRYELAFVAAAVIGLAVPAIVSWSLPPARSPRAPLRWAAVRAGLTEVVRHRLVMVTSTAHAAQFMLNGALNAFVPLYGRDTLGLTTPQLGLLFGAQTITTLAMRPLIGMLSDRTGRRGAIVAGLLICSAAVWAMAEVSDGRSLALAVVAYAAGVATTTAATSAFVTDLTHHSRYGAAHGLFGTIYDIGDALGPIGAGVVVAAYGYATVFRILAGIAVTMAIVFAVTTQRHYMVERDRLSSG